MDRHSLRGPLFILAAALCFSLGGLFIRLSPFSPLATNGGRCAIAALFTLFFQKKRPRPNSSIWTAALAVCLTGVLYTGATRFAGAGVAITLQYTSTAFVVLLSFLLFRERPSRRDVAACALVLAGVILVFRGGFSGAGLAGCCMGLGSGISYACVFLARRFPGAEMQSGYLLGEILGAAIGLPFLWKERALFSLSAIGVLAVLGVFQMGLSYLLLAKGLEETPPLPASLIASVEPVLNPLWAALFLKEQMSQSALLGAGLVLAACLWSTLSPQKTGPSAHSRRAHRQTLHKNIRNVSF